MSARVAFRIDPLESARIDPFLSLGLSTEVVRRLAMGACETAPRWVRGLNHDARRCYRSYAFRYGFCNELDSSALIGVDSVDEVVSAVLVAEGWDPVMCDREIKAYLEQAVDDWLFNPHGRGAKSKLPH
jgi:hypothetical protein